MPGEPSTINAKVFVPGRGVGYQGPRKLLTFDMISDWIRMQGFDEYTTNGLIDLASRYPTQALPSFRRNFNLMIARVRAKRQEEQNPPSNTPEEVTPLEGDPALNVASVEECCEDGECSLDQMQESFDEIDPTHLVVPEDEVNEHGNS
jgi:hypothetical protein